MLWHVNINKNAHSKYICENVDSQKYTE